MTRTGSLFVSAGVLFAANAPAYAGVGIPAPIIGAGVYGLAALGLAGGGYLLLKWRNRKG